MSELLFECYHVPSVAYGVDALFSLSFNQLSPSSSFDGLDALVLSFGYEATHVLPILNGRLQVERCRRINVGGSTVDAFLLRILQLKYPYHQNSLNLSRAEVSVKSVIVFTDVVLHIFVILAMT